MSLGNMWFACEQCGCIDHLEYTAPLFNGTGMRCHKCMTGEWHNGFPQVQYDPQLYIVLNVRNPDLDRIAEQPRFI